MTDEERVMLRVIAGRLEAIAAEMAAYYPEERRVAAGPHEWKVVESSGASAPEAWKVVESSGASAPEARG